MFVLQGPHGASRVRVFSPFQGRWLQSGGPHDARSTQRGHGEGHRAVSRKYLLTLILLSYSLYRTYNIDIVLNSIFKGRLDLNYASAYV